MIILQVDFKFKGPFSEEMTEQFTELAYSINDEEGFISKIWTENKDTGEAGGIYLFNTLENATSYEQKHTKRLKEFGVSSVNVKKFYINESLSEINHFKLDKD